MSGLAVQIVRSAVELEALTDAWWSLWRRSPTATPFTSPAWLVPWWQAFAPGELATLAVWRGGALVALAPLWIEDGAWGRRFLPLGIGISDLFDLLIDPAEPEVGMLLLRSMLDLLGEAATLSLEELPGNALALALDTPPGFASALGEQSARPVLDLYPNAPDDPVSCVPKSKRRALRLAQNRVARSDSRIEPVGSDGVVPFLDDLARLHGARWAERGEAGVLADDRVRRFHAAALPRLHEAGLARLFRLVIDEQVAGAHYGLADRRSAYFYIGGFDPAFAFERPGTALIGYAIAAAAGEGLARFDFLRGQEAYKYEWGAVDQVNRRRTMERRSVA